MVSYKVISPVTGDVQRTSSKNTFRSGGMQFSVKENLAPGEEAKYNKGGDKAETPQIVKPDEEGKLAEQEVVVKVPKVKKQKVVTPKKTVVPQEVAPEGTVTPKKKKFVETAPIAPAEGEGSGWWF